MKVDAGYFGNAFFANQIGEAEREIDEETMARSLAKALKVLRLWHGYTLKKVGEATDIPFQTIARYENGENIPGVIQAYKLACFYKFSLNDMFLLGQIDDLENNYSTLLDQWETLPKQKD